MSIIRLDILINQDHAGLTWLTMAGGVRAIRCRYCRAGPGEPCVIETSRSARGGNSYGDSYVHNDRSSDYRKRLIHLQELVDLSVDNPRPRCLNCGTELRQDGKGGWRHVRQPYPRGYKLPYKYATRKPPCEPQVRRISDLFPATKRVAKKAAAKKRLPR